MHTNDDVDHAVESLHEDHGVHGGGHVLAVVESVEKKTIEKCPQAAHQ